ncbi:hypothetical protein F2P81_026300 [Scophthalmus maximus]|uniref:Uncharacterized protein n=1 Tax=Scophthalmus maximus TaxID=52904 RepID=A0A6A4RMQ9_SCOMX|nr:hypothetical protein F2P81_026300 [Scophthalmus maximus]
MTSTNCRFTSTRLRHQSRLHTATELDGSTEPEPDRRYQKKSCINNDVIGHRSAASLCNPRTRIMPHRFVQACQRNPPDRFCGCDFLIDLR